MKKVLLFIAIFCAVLTGAKAQNTDATISANYVQYWVGTGNNQAIFIVNWCDPDTALAWGFKFSEDSLLVSDMLTAITTADSRLSYAGTLSWLTDLTYTSGTETFQISPDYIMYNVNGNYADVADAQYFHPGDYVKFGGYGCAVLDENWTATWTTPVTPVSIPTSVENYDSQKLSVYPNPCTESVRIQTNVNDDVVLYNLQGAVVMSTVATDEITTLDVNGLSSGIYFVKSGNKTAKIVKR